VSKRKCESYLGGHTTIGLGSDWFSRKEPKGKRNRPTKSKVPAGGRVGALGGSSSDYQRRKKSEWPIISKSARRPNKSMTSGKPKPKAYKGGNERQEKRNVELAPSPPRATFLGSAMAHMNRLAKARNEALAKIDKRKRKRKTKRR
jgi:hypothetical protein